MSKQLQLDVAQLTDVGRKRPHNEDNMAYVIPKDSMLMAKKGALFIVADGMGGHAAGEVASEIAVDTVSKIYYEDDSDDVTTSLVRAIKRANLLIHQRAAENMLRSGMGTTCVAAVVWGNTAYIANVGDSRAYMVHTRTGQAKQVSQDHSWVEEQVRAGLLSREQARSHAQRNVITRCLGTQPDVEVDIFSETLEESDTLVLCTDGLSGPVDDEDIRTIINQHLPQESVYHLVERANENGGPDNITAIVIRVTEVGAPEAPGARRPMPVGGRDVSEEATTMLSQLANSVVGRPTGADNGRLLAGATLRDVTSPLLTKEAGNIPQSGVVLSRRKRGRLFYSTAVLLVLLIIILVGGGAYYSFYFLFNSSIDVDSSLTRTTSLVTQANTEVMNNPADALTKLAQAQKILHDIKSSPLTGTQEKRYNDFVQNDFIPTVQSAIKNYNHMSSIATLPCPPSNKAHLINNSSTATQAEGIAIVQEGNNNKIGRYALGNDHNRYQIDDHYSLINKQSLADKTVAIIGDNPHVAALTSQTGSGSNAATYSLNLLTPDDTGKLNTNDTARLTLTNGQIPTLITAWDTDIYIVLTSSTEPNKATILDYPVTAENKLDGTQPPLAISVSAANIVSITAWPNHQLFLLNSDGSVQSLLFGPRNVPTTVSVNKPIASPLSVGAPDFTLAMNVPTPAPSSSNTLAIRIASAPHASTFLSADQVGNTSHLYIVGSMDHRILDLKQAPTNANITATSNGNDNAGPISMQLVQQYASPTLLNVVKGVDSDPANPMLYLLTSNGQDTAQTNLLSVDTSKACIPTIP